jgi:signal transduction histidine kinase
VNTEQRVLITAPLGADGRNIGEVLAGAGLDTLLCHDLAMAAGQLAAGCAALLVTEEAMDTAQAGLLAAQLDRQAPWSDVPVVLITSGGQFSPLSTRATRSVGARANLTLIERPLRSATLVATVKAALRARNRQYEIRDLLADRERLLASLEERVAERTSSLRQMVEELEAFSYSVSHDLRAPLRVLDGYARALLEDHGDSLAPEAKELLTRIARTAHRMDRLTQDLLAYTRVSRGELTLEPVDLELMLRAVIEQYPSLIASSHLIHLRPPLGTVLGHGPSLIQCFSNLLENALKFAGQEKPPYVEIYAEPRGDRIRVTVADHGMGIDPAQQQRIFGMFERAAAHKHLAGTGIGLAIVKKTAERMGGSVGVESEPGNGARFWLELAMAETAGRCASPERKGAPA